MNKELILKSDILDIIFDNRNKNYGAYPLRKFYTDRLKKALAAMLIIASGFSAFTFLLNKNVYDTITIIIDGPEPGHVKKPENKSPVNKPKTAIPVQKNAATGKLVSTIMIVSTKDSSDKLNIDLDNLAIGSTTNNNSNAGGPQIITPAINGEITETVKPLTDRSIPVSNPEIMPEYPGGLSALRKFLERNLNNPKDMEEGEEVNVKIRFVVGIDGKLQSFVTVQDGGEEFNKEVIRVLKKMPEWIPGKANGEYVSVYYIIPVKFVPQTNYP